ncbi:hypothetical protein D4R20_03560 [bacterium]|nr:MAG: hypothetical protein D4R20_03560 [bacterium]
MNIYRTIKISLFGLFLVTALFHSACKKSNILTTPGETKVVPDDSGRISIRTKLPETFPKTIPIYDKLRLKGNIYAAEGSVVLFDTKESVSSVVDFYKKTLESSGYMPGEGADALVYPDGGIIGWKKGAEEVGIMLSVEKETGVTNVVLIYK